MMAAVLPMTMPLPLRSMRAKISANVHCWPMQSTHIQSICLSLLAQLPLGDFSLRKKNTRTAATKDKGMLMSAFVG